MHDLDDRLAGLKAKGIHTVARVVVFKDDVLARYRPEWAVADTTTGSPWRDNERLAWIDPFHEDAWAYPIAVAREAALKGFDEIQFDYLRFPSDGRLGAARYSRASTMQSRVQAIARFLAQARLALAPVGAALAIDVFGYTGFNPDDTGVGQRIEELAPLVDVLCPMAYPSAYHVGIPGFRDPVAHPYEVVLETVRRIRGAIGAGAGPGSALDPGLPRLRLRPPFVRGARDSRPDERRPRWRVDRLDALESRQSLHRGSARVQQRPG